ncbi:uncharacterized protein LY89DRAFT_718352 [Mollisia scopiformis]|uniref:Uncharacterized protein n=1 Tax=Mollisia scopiformis TaxID=149040 RepID=A0A194XC27_MOLSC|nr:uncharacterized protein LY89DRAFT_718352 [Mollisia scopiformis]KUJ17711.1 hypothetical protein LY89DRAFT_718352 [Mollisia scopiformis]
MRFWCKVIAFARSCSVTTAWTVDYNQLQPNDNSTAAVRDVDGHVENIINIPGSAEYIALMQELTTHPNRLRPPILNTFSHQFRFLLKIVQRRNNLFLGRPGSTNAATLGSMLRMLRSETESRLSISITTIGLAIPNAAFASHEEVNDALVYAGLKPLPKRAIHDGDFNAVYAAHGYGLCATYADPYKCEKEENAMKDGDELLHLDYTNRTLSANTDWIKMARSKYAATNIVDWELGSDQKGTSGYWENVKERVRRLKGKKEFTQLLLSGERAGDEDFLETVKDALWDAEVEVREQDIDFRFVVARGAAEMQWRRQRGWLDCVQPKYCREKTVWGRLIGRFWRMFELWPN